MSFRSAFDKLKGAFAIILGLGIALVFIGGIAEVARQQIFLLLLEDEWPALRPGAQHAQVYRLAWADGVKLTMLGDSGDSRLSISGTQVHFGEGPRAVFDPGCGSFCNRAFVLEKLTCTGKDLYGYPSGATTCEFHMWETGEGERSCFLSMEKAVGTNLSPLSDATRELLGLGLSGIGIDSKPDDMHIDCPSSVLALRR